MVLMRGVKPDRMTPEELQAAYDIVNVGKLSKNKSAVDEFTEGM